MRPSELSMSTLASPRRAFSVGEASARPHDAQRQRTGRGPPVLKRSLLQVEHGGPPSTASTRASETSSRKRTKVSGTAKSQRGSSAMSTDSISRMRPAVDAACRRQSSRSPVRRAPAKRCMTTKVRVTPGEAARTASHQPSSDHPSAGSAHAARLA